MSHHFILSETLSGPVLTLIFGSFFFGCGITNSDYVKYAPTTTSTPTSTSAECTAALQGFKDNISSAISSTCAVAGCHLSQTIAGNKLSATDDEANRSTFKAYTGTDPSKLFNKISMTSGQTHSGGNQSSALPLAKITAWTTLESKCL